MCDAGVRAERRALGLSPSVEGSAATPPFSMLVNPAGVTARGLAVGHSIAAAPPAAEQAGQACLDGEKMCVKQSDITESSSRRGVK